jgi:hypothetical protein
VIRRREIPKGNDFMKILKEKSVFSLFAGRVPEEMIDDFVFFLRGDFYSISQLFFVHFRHATLSLNFVESILAGQSLRGERRVAIPGSGASGTREEVRRLQLLAL